MDTLTFKPSQELTFDTVIANREGLYQKLMAKGDHFYLDLSDVLHCDSAGLALLIEAKKLCKQQGKTFAMIGMSSETQSLAEFCGVQDMLLEHYI